MIERNGLTVAALNNVYTMKLARRALLK